MPPLATDVINQRAVDLLTDWITRELPALVASNNITPTIAINQPTSTFDLPLGLGLMLDAGAADSDGSITNLQFWINDVPQPPIAAGRMRQWWIPSATGTYQIRAQANDNDGAVVVTESRVLRVVSGGPNVPLLRLIDPIVFAGGRIKVLIDGAERLGGIELSTDLAHWREAGFVRTSGNEVMVWDPVGLSNEPSRIFLRATWRP